MTLSHAIFLSVTSRHLQVARSAEGSLRLAIWRLLILPENDGNKTVFPAAKLWQVLFAQVSTA